MSNEYWGNQPNHEENNQAANAPVIPVGSEPAPERGYSSPYTEDNGGYNTTYTEPQAQPQQSAPNPGYGQVPPQNPYGGMYTYTPEPPQPKKKRRVLPLVLGAIALVIVGCLAGGIGVHAYLTNGTEEGTTAPEVVQEESVVEESEEKAPIEENSAFNTTTIDIKTNSTANELTPQDVFENYVNAVVAISNESTTNIFGQYATTASSGSGMILSEDGYILTNNHVIDGAEKLTVIMTSGEEYEATVIGADSENDVALIKIDATGLPTVAVGDSSEIQVGEQVCAIGNPLGELTNTLTVGYISALDREINEDETPINMFQTDCAINSGNSGGPIFDMNGNVVGITTAKYSSSSSSGASIEGIGFCIPINDAMDIVADLLQYGYVRGRASLGISCQTIPSTITQYYNFPTGVYVYSVEAGSAAETAGLKQGDIITAMDGQEVGTVADLKAMLKDFEAGQTVALTVFRSETMESMEISVTLDEKVATVNTEEETETEENTQPQQGQQGGYSYGYSFPFGY